MREFVNMVSNIQSHEGHIVAPVRVGRVEVEKKGLKNYVLWDEESSKLQQCISSDIYNKFVTY